MVDLVSIAKGFTVRYITIIPLSLLLFASAAYAQDLTSADAYSQRGIARFEKIDLDGAIADFTKVIEMNGKDQEFCYYFRGMAHYRDRAAIRESSWR